MAQSPSAIDVQDVIKTYANGIRAIDGVSFAVRHGEVFGLLGVNGAGKTTTIKCLTTLLTPSSGSIKILGMDIRQKPVEVKKRLGVVPQENNLDTRLTVRQNLVFHSKYFGIRKSDYNEAVDRWMDCLGLKDKGNEMVYHLSGGTKRKVMLAKAFITNPEILMLDEPTSGLDPQVRGLIWDRIRKFREFGRTALLSTHHLEEAERLCNRVGIIHCGKLLFTGTPEELRKTGVREGVEATGIEESFHLIIGEIR